jgi:hypothetical protein
VCWNFGLSYYNVTYLYSVIQQRSWRGTLFSKIKYQYKLTREAFDVEVFTFRVGYLRGPFAKFVDSPSYSESNLCGVGVTVSFSKYHPWQAMHFLQRSTHFSKTCCRPLIISKFLTLELPFHGWKSPEIAWSEIWTEFCIRLEIVDRWNPIRTSAIQSSSHPLRFLGFSNHEKGAPRQEISKWSTVPAHFREVGGAL